MKSWDDLSEIQRTILLDIRENGPDCAKFLSRRIKRSLKDTMLLLSGLEKAGWLQRVKGTFLFKPGFKRPKHMNHTYYELTRPAQRELRFLARRGNI